MKIWSYPGCSKAEIDSRSGVQICNVFDLENPGYGDVAGGGSVELMVYGAVVMGGQHDDVFFVL